MATKTQLFTRSESRLLRPFVSPENLLRGASISINGSDQVPIEGTFDKISDERIESVLISIPPININQLVSLGYETADLSFVAIQSAEPFHKSVVVENIGDLTLLQDGCQFSPELPFEFGPLVSGYLDIAIVLTTSSKVGDLRASRKGSWLCRERMTFSHSSNQRMFEVKYYEPAWFVSQGLSPQTGYFIDLVEEGARQEVTDPSSMLNVIVNNDIARLLEKGSGQIRGGMFFNSLLTDLLAVVLHTGYSDNGSLPSENTVLGSASRYVSRALKVSEEKLASLCHESQYGFVHALVQGATSSVNEIRKAVK